MLSTFEHSHDTRIGTLSSSIYPMHGQLLPFFADPNPAPSQSGLSAFSASRLLSHTPAPTYSTSHLPLERVHRLLLPSLDLSMAEGEPF